MSKILAINWNTDVLRYVVADIGRRSDVRLLNVGERSLSIESDESDHRVLTEELKAVASGQKVGRAKLVLCVGRGSIDSARFTVPPSTDAELPTLVGHMAQRQISGLQEDAIVDFVSFPQLDDGSRSVSAMAMSGADGRLIQQLVDASGCTTAAAVVVTHSLRYFAPQHDPDDRSASLVVSKGLEAADFLVVQHGNPVLSRTLRLAPGASTDQAAAFIAGEIQRTMLTIGDRLERGADIMDAVLVGEHHETSALAAALEGRIAAAVTQRSAVEHLENDVSEAEQGAYAPLIAAICEQAGSVSPAVDFLAPRRPPKQQGPWTKVLAVAAAVLILGGGTAYYIHTLFAEAEGRIADVQPQLENLSERLKQTSGMRRQAIGIGRWNAARMNWLDELRDLTIRMPSSPDLTVNQFAATPAGGGYTVVFRGVSKSPDLHRAMEIGIQDRYHSTKTPSFSQSGSGDKAVWNFRTTLQIRRRPAKAYTAHRKLLTKYQQETQAKKKTPSSNARSTREKSSPKNSESAPRGEDQL